MQVGGDRYGKGQEGGAPFAPAGLGAELDGMGADDVGLGVDGALLGAQSRSTSGYDVCLIRART